MRTRRNGHSSHTCWIASPRELSGSPTATSALSDSYLESSGFVTGSYRSGRSCNIIHTTLVRTGWAPPPPPARAPLVPQEGTAAAASGMRRTVKILDERLSPSAASDLPRGDVEAVEQVGGGDPEHEAGERALVIVLGGFGPD